MIEEKKENGGTKFIDQNRKKKGPVKLITAVEVLDNAFTHGEKLL